MCKSIRNILIVDDSEFTEANKIKQYLKIFENFKKECTELNYDLKFFWNNNIDDAITRLNNKTEVFHVVLVDYEFNDDEKGRKGISIVKEIRKTINKRCKIIFYTMRGYKGIDKEEYVYLINNDVFRFISKSGEEVEQSFESELRSYSADEAIVKSIIAAIDESDPISNALESFLIEYSEILKDVKISINNNDYLIQEIIDSIRLDTELGNLFINKMLKMSILDCINFLE